MTDGTRCRYPGCDGAIEDGYCEDCGRAALAEHALSGARGATPAPAPAGLPPAGPPPPPPPSDWAPPPSGYEAAPPPAAPPAAPSAWAPAQAAGPTALGWSAAAPATEAPPPPPTDPVRGGWSGAVDPDTGSSDRGKMPMPDSTPSGRSLPSVPSGGRRVPSALASIPSGSNRPVTSPTHWLGQHTPADGTPCAYPGCGGRLESGYCEDCGRAPAVDAVMAVDGTAAPSAPSGPLLRPASVRTRTGSGRIAKGKGRTDSGSIGSRRSGGTRLGLGLVDVPAVPTGDPAAATMAHPEVPEDKRYCSNCNNPVGRTRSHRVGRTEGFCPTCRTRFSFTPKLTRGEIVAGQYEVLGALAHGGLGWIYLARDRAVSDRWVVLKGLLDTNSDAAAVAAVAERQFLAALDHPNIVQIYNFVTHEGAGYIVMEYVGGKSLKTVLKERREANGGRTQPLPVGQAIAYGLATLPALGYFHAQGLVYCDMKPDNVVLVGDSLKLIDLGGVRRIADDTSAIYGTIGFQAPEVADDGPSVASDLYTVGRMLAVLTLDFRGYQTDYVHRLPTPETEPLFRHHESLYRFLLKATATDPHDRFSSAEEMAEQLLGILRENAATRGAAQPGVSRMFGPDGLVGGGAGLAGLGSGALDDVAPDWRLLPLPKVDPTDPGVGFLLSLADGEPAAVVATLDEALAGKTVPASPETLLHLARAKLVVGDAPGAEHTLDQLPLGDDWRIWWHKGLHALASGVPGEGIGWLDPVYTELPGEVAAKLGLALAHEQAGHLARAAQLYDVASRTDPSYVSGAFGLARVRAAAGDREGAVDALSRVPVASSVHGAALVAMVRILASTSTDAPSTPEQLDQASTILGELHLDPRRHALIARELFEAGLATVAAGRARGSTGRILGRPLAESPLREGLESMFRQLARLAGSTAERHDYVDRANRARPRTLL